jgi:hypothetical protein
VRTFASTTLVACFALAPAALAQTVTPPPAANAPAAAPNGDEPTPPTGGPAPKPDVPTPPEPSPPTPLEPTPAPPVSGPVETPGALTSAPTPAAMLGVNVPHEKRDVPPRAPEPATDAWQDGHALAIEAGFRGGSRVGATNLVVDNEEKAGLGFDLGVALRLAPAFSFGFALKRMSLGTVSSTSGNESAVNASYMLTKLELGARVYPVRWRTAELFVGLHVAMAWQSVDASGLRPSVNLEPPDVYSCSDTAGPSFALGAELGAAVRLTRAFWLVGDFAGDGYHFTSEPVGNCVNGLGSITALSVGVNLLYAFDLGREAKVAATPRPSAF